MDLKAAAALETALETDLAQDLAGVDASSPEQKADGEKGDGEKGEGKDDDSFTISDDDEADEPVQQVRRRRDRRPGQGLPQADRQGRPAQRRAGGRARQAHRGRPVRRGEAQLPATRSTPSTSASSEWIAEDGQTRQEPPARGQPAPRRLAGQALHRPRHAVPGPDPGGQPRPDPRGREVRLHQGLQVLDVRHLVDPAGDHPRHGRPGPHHPHPGAHGRGHQQAGPRAAPDAAGPGPRAHARRSSPRSST